MTNHRYRATLDQSGPTTSAGRTTWSDLRSRRAYSPLPRDPDQRLLRSIAHAQGWQPTDVTRAVVAQVWPHLDHAERFTLLEDMGRDTCGTLRHLLTTFTLGPALAQLVRRALDLEERREVPWSLTR